MGIAVSLLISAVGLILALAVHPTNPGSVDPNTVGWILFVVGLVGLILDLLLWSNYGPGYLRRTTVELRLRWFTRSELELLLESTCWSVEELYGSYGLDPFGPSSDRLIIVARPA